MSDPLCGTKDDFTRIKEKLRPHACLLERAEVSLNTHRSIHELC